MARLVHTAVNLSLIVALLMQPAFAYGTGQGCAAGCRSGFTCQGCSCCNVQSGSVKCGCCSRQPPDDQGQGSCCGTVRHRKSPASDVRTIDDGPPFAGVALQHGAIPEQHEKRDQPSEKNDPLGSKFAAPSHSTACNCVRAPNPFGAPSPRSSVTELTDATCLIIVIVARVDSLAGQPLASAISFRHAKVVPHFSQTSFCVWRL